jgi:D-alanyl-D-alanine carboxypeptidase
MRPTLAATLCAVVVFAVATRADRADDYIKAQMDQFHVPGLSLVVLKNGRVVRASAYGVIDVKRGTTTTVNSVFKIGSISKQFIATAIMLLAQDGSLRVDDRVSTYLDDTPTSWAPITIRHLLTHTSGLERESPAFDPMKVQSDGRVIEALYRRRLLFRPGSKWEYSNAGYIVLAEIITRVSHRPWADFIRDRVFMPAEMNVTVPTNAASILPNRSLGYTGRHNGRVAAEWIALKPSGAFASTVMDLAKWDAILNGTTILSDASRRDMWQPVRLNNGSTYPYGFGWHVENWGGHRVVWHDGVMPGFSAQFLRFDDGLSVIMLANANDFGAGRMATRFGELYRAAEPLAGRDGGRQERP